MPTLIGTTAEGNPVYLREDGSRFVIPRQVVGNPQAAEQFGDVAEQVSTVRDNPGITIDRTTPAVALGSQLNALRQGVNLPRSIGEAQLAAGASVQNAALPLFDANRRLQAQTTPLVQRARDIRAGGEVAQDITRGLGQRLERIGQRGRQKKVVKQAQGINEDLRKKLEKIAKRGKDKTAGQLARALKGNNKTNDDEEEQPPQSRNA